MMTTKDLGGSPNSSSVQDLRKRAEALAREMPEDPESLSPEAMRRALHELQVHQIELEMQNEELSRAQQELEASRNRYFDLYDLAPVGYFTLSEAGLILEANLTAAKLHGVPRADLVKQPLSRFILPKDQDIHYRRSKQLLGSRAPQSWELRLLRKDSEPFWARIEAATARDSDGASVWRAIVTDITERKRAEQLIQTHSDELHEFADTLSRDLQEPLRTVLNLTQVLAREHQGKLGETTDKYFAHCLESASKMDVLLKGLLNYLVYRAR